MSALAVLAKGGSPALPAGAVPDLPPWVPAPGTRRSISLNTLAAVDPCPARDCAYSGVVGQDAVLAAWSGGAFATDRGMLGALLVTGGGHGDYYGNEVYAFDLGARRWSRLSDPFPGGPDTPVDYDEGEYTQGVPLSSHTYQNLQYLPARLGGGLEGSLLLVTSYAAGRLARGSGRSHAFDVARGSWSRFSANKSVARATTMSSTCFDATRGGYWLVPYGGDTIHFLNPTTRLWSSVNIGRSGGNNFGIDHVCAHDPEGDRLVVLDWPRKEPVRVWVAELAAPAGWQSFDAVGESPPYESRGMGIEWCPPRRQFVCYEGKGTAHVRLLAAPHPGGREPWTWSRETLTGDPPIQNPRATGVYNRFRWAPSIRSFLYAEGRALPVQAWRLNGT